MLGRISYKGILNSIAAGLEHIYMVSLMSSFMLRQYRKPYASSLVFFYAHVVAVELFQCCSM